MLGPRTISLAQPQPPALLRPRGRVMLQPSPLAENAPNFLTPPLSSPPPSWIPKSQKPLSISARGLFGGHAVCVHVRRKNLL